MSKIAILSFSGNVGKSTLAQFLLLPRFPNAVHMTVETINSNTSDTKSVIQVKGKEVEVVQEELLLSEELIVDVGASNIESFLSGMNLFEGSIDDFDAFIIPVTPESKQQVDTVSTVMELIEMGVPVKKIKVVYNRVPPESDISVLFRSLQDALAECKVAIFKSSIPETTVFEKANDFGMTLEEILSDETDYRALIKATDKTDPARKEMAAKVMLPRVAITVKKRLDQVAKDIL